MKKQVVLDVSSIRKAWETLNSSSAGHYSFFVDEKDIYNIAEPKKKVKKWLWATPSGQISPEFSTENDSVKLINYINNDIGNFTVKLLWSETEFEE